MKMVGKGDQTGLTLNEANKGFGGLTTGGGLTSPQLSAIFYLRPNQSYMHRTDWGAGFRGGKPTDV
jgi:hypothetical protein